MPCPAPSRCPADALRQTGGVLTPAAVSQVRRAVRSALRVEAGGEAAWSWQGAVPADDFVEAVARHRVAALLAAARAPLALPDEVGDAVDRLAEWSRLDAMASVRQVRVVVDLLDGLDHLLLKGVPLALHTTGDPLGRGPGDVDVLVRPDQLDEALDRLLSAGWRGRDGYTVDRSAWAWRYQRWSSYEVALEGASGDVDLHWRLDPTHAGLPGFDRLWQRRREYAAGGTTVAAPGPADTVAHVLRHAAKDGWNSLRGLVDVHRLARDPSSWPHELDRLDRATLTVTRACVGLPDGVPPFAEERLGLASALATQARGLHLNRFPGDHLSRYLSYVVRSSRHPQDLALAASIAVLPPVVAAELPDRTATAAVSHALRNRAGRLSERLSERLADRLSRRLSGGSDGQEPAA